MHLQRAAQSRCCESFFGRDSGWATLVYQLRSRVHFRRDYPNCPHLKHWFSWQSNLASRWNQTGRGPPGGHSQYRYSHKSIHAWHTGLALAEIKLLNLEKWLPNWLCCSVGPHLWVHRTFYHRCNSCLCHREAQGAPISNSRVQHSNIAWWNFQLQLISQPAPSLLCLPGCSQKDMLLQGQVWACKLKLHVKSGMFKRGLRSHKHFPTLVTI